MIDSKVLSGDSHIDLRFMPENTFLDNAPAGLRDRMPHIEETQQGLRWLADGCDLGVVGTFVTETQSTEMNERTRLMVEGGAKRNHERKGKCRNCSRRAKCPQSLV